MWGGDFFADESALSGSKAKKSKKEKKKEKRKKEQKREAKRRRKEEIENGGFVIFQQQSDGKVNIRAGAVPGSRKHSSSSMDASSQTQHLVAVQGQGPRWGGNNTPSEKTALGKAIMATAQTFQCGACGFQFRAYWGSSVDCSSCGGNIDIPYTKEQAMDISKQTTQGCAKTTSNSKAWQRLRDGGLMPGGPAKDGPLQITAGPGVESRALTTTTKGQALSSGKTQLQGLASKYAAQQDSEFQGDLVQTVAGHPWVLGLRFAPVNMGQRDLEERHIILMMGQSNMSGRDKNMPIEFRNPLDGPCWSVDENGRFKRGCAEPMCPHDGRSSGCGPGRAFCERVFQIFGEENHGIIMLPCAVGATSLAQWQRGQMLYSVSVSRARSVARACGGRIAGVLWHQGEDDGCAKVTAERYHELMMQLINDLRNDLGEGLPVVMGSLGPFLDEESLMPVHRHADVINLALRNLGQLPGNATCPGSEHCMADRLHFDALGQREMGHKYADAWATLWSRYQLSIRRVGPDGKPYNKEQWGKKFGDFKGWSRAPDVPDEFQDSDDDDDSDSSSVSLADMGISSTTREQQEYCTQHMMKLHELADAALPGLQAAGPEPMPAGMPDAMLGEGGVFGLGGGGDEPVQEPEPQANDSLLRLQAPADGDAPRAVRAPSLRAPNESDSDSDDSSDAAA